MVSTRRPAKLRPAERGAVVTTVVFNRIAAWLSDVRPAPYEEKFAFAPALTKSGTTFPVVTWGADLKGFVRHRTGI